MRRLRKAESLLWRGQVDETQALFVKLTGKQAQNFCDYLEKHRHRIVNYEYFQSEQICSIGSGAVESAVKQIDRRTKISGAQWNIENVPKRVSASMRLSQWSYLNDYISDRSLAKVTCSHLNAARNLAQWDGFSCDLSLKKDVSVMDSSDLNHGLLGTTPLPKARAAHSMNPVKGRIEYVQLSLFDCTSNWSRCENPTDGRVAKPWECQFLRQINPYRLDLA